MARQPPLLSPAPTYTCCFSHDVVGLPCCALCPVLCWGSMAHRKAGGGRPCRPQKAADGRAAVDAVARRPQKVGRGQDEGRHQRRRDGLRVDPREPQLRPHDVRRGVLPVPAAAAAALALNVGIGVAAVKRKRRKEEEALGRRRIIAALGPRSSSSEESLCLWDLAVSRSEEEEAETVPPVCGYSTGRASKAAWRVSLNLVCVRELRAGRPRRSLTARTRAATRSC
jgi:hypothetical protein